MTDEKLKPFLLDLYKTKIHERVEENKGIQMSFVFGRNIKCLTVNKKFYRLI